MKMTIRAVLVAAFLVFTFGTPTQAQSYDCDEPTAHKFSEFDYQGTDDLQKNVVEFENKLREFPVSQGIVFVFGGRHSKIDEITKLTALVERTFTISKSGYDSRIWIRDGGYRNYASFVFLFKGKPCTSYSSPLADLRPDEVDFEGFSGESTIRQSNNELIQAAIKRPAAPCPPAATAVRACSAGTTAEVFILVDSNGKVVYAKAISSHPLLRGAAEVNATNWDFKGPNALRHSSNRSGIVNIVFIEGAKLSSN